MKKLLPYLLLLLSANNLSAQKILKTTFYDETGNEVSVEKSDYIRVIKTTSNESIYEFIETWKDGTLKITGFLTEYFPTFKQTGKETIYHKNGKIKTIQYIEYVEKVVVGNVQATLPENMSVGKIKMFYENGKLKEEGEFREPTSEYTVSRFNYPNYIVKQIADSLGNMFLDSSGTGKVNITYANGDSVEGEYISGLKQGQRKEFYAQSSTTYIEEFENGKLLKGRYIDKTGEETNYNTLEKFPEFEGGIAEFYKFLSSNMKYPRKMRKQRIEGEVRVKFAVEKDGSITDCEIAKGVSGGEELEMEAIRVIQLSPNWIPGEQRGNPIKVFYSVPIVFALGK